MKKNGAKFIDFLDHKSPSPKSSSQDFSEYKNEELNNKNKEKYKTLNIKSPKEGASDIDQALNEDSSSRIDATSDSKKEGDAKERSFDIQSCSEQQEDNNQDELQEDKNYCLLDEDKNINPDLVSKFAQIEPVIIQADYSTHKIRTKLCWTSDHC